MDGFLNQALDVLSTGFAQINDPKGLLIALAATVFLTSWGQWIPVSIVAVVVHIAIERLAPILAGQSGALSLPPIMEHSFWVRTGILLVGYLLVIGIFFFVKRILMASGGGGKAKH